MPAETCLVADTLITLADMSQKKISLLKKGDKILSFNFETGQNEPDEIEGMGNPIHSNMVKLTLDSCEIICTPDHPWYSKKDGWVSENPYRTEMYYKVIFSARLIQKGMFLKAVDGLKKKVLKVTRYKKEQRTFNLSALKKNYTYYANGILTAIE